MNKIAERLKVYIETHPFDPGDSDCTTVLDQLYQVYAESHESDLPEISEGFKELEEFLCKLPLDDNNAVFNLCCRLCIAYERKSFLDGLLYGAHLILELFTACQTSVFEQESIFGQRHKDVRIYYRRQFLGIKDLRLSNM